MALGVCPALISIHALREEGDWHRYSGRRAYCISIHALREEGDISPVSATLSFTTISIHALREEGDLINADATTIT